jgi:hypothetical protein
VCQYSPIYAPEYSLDDPYLHGSIHPLAELLDLPETGRQDERAVAGRNCPEKSGAAFGERAGARDAVGRPKGAAEVKLFEHPDFGQAILQAAEHFHGEGWRPAIVEKDYFVTETLPSSRTTTESAEPTFQGAIPILTG